MPGFAVQNDAFGAINGADNFFRLRLAHIGQFLDIAPGVTHVAQYPMLAASGFVDIPEGLTRQIFRF